MGKGTEEEVSCVGVCCRSFGFVQQLRRGNRGMKMSMATVWTPQWRFMSWCPEQGVSQVHFNLRITPFCFFVHYIWFYSFKREMYALYNSLKSPSDGRIPMFDLLLIIEYIRAVQSVKLEKTVSGWVKVLMLKTVQDKFHKRYLLQNGFRLKLGFIPVQKTNPERVQKSQPGPKEPSRMAWLSPTKRSSQMKVNALHRQG